MYKFGIKIPKSVQNSNEFDEDNGNTLWCDDICKEIKNIRHPVEFRKKDISEWPPVYQKNSYHMIFDVKMGKNFRRKALFF